MRRIFSIHLVITITITINNNNNNCNDKNIDNTYNENTSIENKRKKV